MIQQAIQMKKFCNTKFVRAGPCSNFYFCQRAFSLHAFLHSQPPKGVVQLANPNLMCCCWSGHDEWSATQYSRDTCIIFLLAWCLVFLFGLFVPEMFDAAVYSHFLKSVVILFWLLFCSESSSCCHVVASLQLVASGAGSMTIIFSAFFNLHIIAPEGQQFDERASCGEFGLKRIDEKNGVDGRVRCKPRYRTIGHQVGTIFY